MSSEVEPNELHKVIVDTDEMNRSLSSIIRYLSEKKVIIESRKIKSSFIVRDFLVFRYLLDDIIHLSRLKLIDRKIEEMNSLCSGNAFKCITVFEISSFNVNSSVMSLIVEMSLKMLSLNIYPFISYSSHFTSTLLYSLLNADKIVSKAFSTKKIDLPTEHTEMTIALAMLQAIPGVGAKRAAKLLYEFGSISEISKHSPFEIAAIAKIPESVAEKIYRVLNERFNKKRV